MDWLESQLILDKYWFRKISFPSTSNKTKIIFLSLSLTFHPLLIDRWTSQLPLGVRECYLSCWNYRKEPSTQEELRTSMISLCFWIYTLNSQFSSLFYLSDLVFNSYSIKSLNLFFLFHMVQIYVLWIFLSLLSASTITHKTVVYTGNQDLPSVVQSGKKGTKSVLSEKSQFIQEGSPGNQHLPKNKKLYRGIGSTEEQCLLMSIVMGGQAVLLEEKIIEMSIKGWVNSEAVSELSVCDLCSCTGFTYELFLLIECIDNSIWNSY